MIAKVIHYDIIFRLGTQKQVEVLVEYLVNTHIDFTHEKVMGETDDLNHTIITIHDHCWASNLMEIGKLMATVDFPND